MSPRSGTHFFLPRRSWRRSTASLHFVSSAFPGNVRFLMFGERLQLAADFESLIVTDDVRRQEKSGCRPREG